MSLDEPFLRQPCNCPWEHFIADVEGVNPLCMGDTIVCSCYYNRRNISSKFSSNSEANAYIMVVVSELYTNNVHIDVFAIARQ